MNGVLVATSEGQIKTHLVILRFGLKQFLSACVNKFMMYIWSLAMKRIFLKHLEIIIEKTGIPLPSYRIVDQSLCFKNDNFFPQKLNKPIFHKNLFDFFVQFPSMMFKNTLLIDYMLHKSLFNLPFSAIFFEMLYGSHTDTNYLLQTVFPYLVSLHSSKMKVYKFVKLNFFWQHYKCAS